MEIQIDEKTLLGKTVEWTSSGGGHTRTKRGVVIAEETPGRHHGLTRMPRECRSAAASRFRFAWVEGWHDGVIVRVERAGRLPLYYAPRRAWLRVVTP